MLFNKNIVLDLMTTNFGEEIEINAMEAVLEMEGYELEEIFDDLVDYAQMDMIDKLEVAQYEVEEDSESQIVSGVLEITVIIDGYVHWDREEVFIDSEETTLTFDFSFEVKADKCSDFYLEQIY